MVEPGTVVIAYVVGIVVTVSAAWFPAWRAARIPPVAAMRDDVTLPQRSLKVRASCGRRCLRARCRRLGARLHRGVPVGGAASLVGLGHVPGVHGRRGPQSDHQSQRGRSSRRSCQVLAGTAGGLAVENAQRNRRRTAATASALMIGLALVSAISVLAASTTASINGVIDDQFKLDRARRDRRLHTVQPRHRRDIAAIDGVSRVSPLRANNAVVEGADAIVTAIDPETIGNAVDLSRWTRSSNP